MVSELRAKTNAGMMECKKALTEANGDFDEAAKILRERGLAGAAKKAGRIASEGVVDIKVEGDKAVIIEVNTETDFATKNEVFKEFVNGVENVIIANAPADVNALLALEYEAGVTVDDKLKELIGSIIRENMSIRRFALVEGITSTYVHGGGAAGVIVKFNADDAAKNNAGFAEFAKNIALQIAAGSPPSYVTREDVPESALEEEKEVILNTIKNDEKNANKPEAILQKMVLGKVGKFYERVCLVDQAYVKDDSLTVGKYIANTAKEFGGEISVDSFILYEMGEGLEKKEDNFGDEIADLLK